MSTVARELMTPEHHSSTAAASSGGGLHSLRLHATQRQVAQFHQIQRLFGGVVQRNGDSPEEILMKLTGKTVSDYTNHRGESFTVIEKAGKAPNFLLILKNPNSTCHLSLPYVEVEDGYAKNKSPFLPHLTGFFNSGTKESPIMQEWKQIYTYEGAPAEDAKEQFGKDRTYLQLGDPAENQFLQSKMTKKHQPGDQRFIRRPSSGALGLERQDLPKI